MGSKLRDYQVIDVSCGGSSYKVKHKTSNELFTWNAHDCKVFSPDELQTVIQEVKVISNINDETLLKYHDTILHSSSKTLYFVLEYITWKNLEEILVECKEKNQFVSEGFIWHILHELTKLCKTIQDINLSFLSQSFQLNHIYVCETGEIKANCFQLGRKESKWVFLKELRNVIAQLCFCGENETDFKYSDDLKDVLDFLSSDKNAKLNADVILYHPTVLANLELNEHSKRLSKVLITQLESQNITGENLETALEVHKSIDFDHSATDEPSPIYANLSPKKAKLSLGLSEKPLSPTLAALALELPGYVPKQPFGHAIVKYKEPEQVSENTLSNQWLSRLIALREREESLNKREMDLIAKEIINSPSTQSNVLHSKHNVVNNTGITLPPVIPSAINDVPENAIVRHRRRSSSVRTRNRRRQTFNYADMDSSLSADAGDGSIVVTSTKFDKDNMPRRNIFPGNKKVHFTSVNPFVESDESVTLTYYELESTDTVTVQQEFSDNINQFKYLDLEKVTKEKRSALNWNDTSPNKQAKMVLNDVTNIKKVPSKTSLMSKSSQSSKSSQYSTASSQKSAVSTSSFQSCIPRSKSGTSMRQSVSTRQSLAPTADKIDCKKSRRLSLMPFKAPFKFMSKG